MKKPDGSSKMREMRIEIHHGQDGKVTGHTVHHHMMPKATKSGAFMEDTHHSFPFDADGNSGSHGHMLDHIGTHLNLTEGQGEKEENEEEEVG